MSEAVFRIQRELMELLLEGEHPLLEVLRVQHAVSRVERIETTGVGFFVHFAVPDSVAAAEPPNFDLGDVWFRLAGADADGGSVLFVRDGRLQMLEGFTWTDPWPEDPKLDGSGYLAVSRRRGDDKGCEQLNLVPSEHRDLSYITAKIREG